MIKLNTVIPHPTDIKDYDSFSKFEARSMHGQLPIIWDRAKGCDVWDRHGNQFLDFTSGIAVTNTGHGNDAVIRGLDHLVHKPLLHSYTFATDARYRFLRELIELCYPGGKAFLVSAGTEATEVACKLMIMHGQKTNPNKRVLLSFKGAMHGRTMLAENLKGITGDNLWAFNFDPPNRALEWEEDFTKIFEKLENVCGIIIESYQGWSAKFFNSSYIQKLVAWAKEHDILVCFDEIQGGFGRTGKLFAYEHYSIDKPDLICIGKGVSGSLPLSGVIGRADILDIPEVGSMSSTHSANPMSCIAGVLNLIEIRQEGLVDYAQAQGIILQTYLREHFGWPRGQYEINGKGLLAAILTKTTEEATEIVWECFKRGLLTIWTHKNSVKLAPPLTIKTDELLEGLEVLNDVLLMRQR
jgi:4-aminobutyrate aminotransferase-like enzyme